MAHKRTSRGKPCRNPIRTGWMCNAVLLCLLLGVIGAAYVWLGDRMATRLKQNQEAQRDIGELEQQIKAVNVHLSGSLQRGDLQMLADRLAPGLKPIPTGPRTGRLIELPMPREIEFQPLAGNRKS